MTAYEPRADDRTKEGTMESINQTIIESQVIEALRTCFDPEIPVTFTRWVWSMISRSAPREW